MNRKKCPWSWKEKTKGNILTVQPWGTCLRAGKAVFWCLMPPIYLNSVGDSLDKPTVNFKWVYKTLADQGMLTVSGPAPFYSGEYTTWQSERSAACTNTYLFQITAYWFYQGSTTFQVRLPWQVRSMPVEDQQTADDNNFKSNTFSPCKVAVPMQETSGLALRSNTSLPVHFPAQWIVLRNLPTAISKTCANRVQNILLISLAVLFRNMTISIWLHKKIMGSESWVSGSFHT